MSAKKNYTQYSNIKLDDLYKFHQQKLANQNYTYCVIASDTRISTDDLKKYGELKIVAWMNYLAINKWN
jgi:hypothetical protein